MNSRIFYSKNAAEMIEESFFNINFQTDSIEKSSIERSHHNKRIAEKRRNMSYFVMYERAAGSVSGLSFRINCRIPRM